MGESALEAAARAAVAYTAAQKGTVEVILDGESFQVVLIRDERGMDPVMGGMLSSAGQSFLLQKTDHPEPPQDAASIIFPQGELSSSELIIGSVVSRPGYWLISCEEASGLS